MNGDGFFSGVCMGRSVLGEWGVNWILITAAAIASTAITAAVAITPAIGGTGITATSVT